MEHAHWHLDYNPDGLVPLKIVAGNEVPRWTRVTNFGPSRIKVLGPGVPVPEPELRAGQSVDVYSYEVLLELNPTDDERYPTASGKYNAAT